MLDLAKTAAVCDTLPELDWPPPFDINNKRYGKHPYLLEVDESIYSPIFGTISFFFYY